VVFLLVMFFLLTSTFQQDRGIDVVLPASDTAEQTSEQQNLYTVSINGEGKLFVEKLEIPIDGLAKRIELWLGKHPDGQVVVRSDGKVEVQTLVAVMDELVRQRRRT
jgi:biopolymer transport protein ExbD